MEEHSDVTGNQGFGRNYTPEEVYLYKKGWEQQCADWHTHSSGPDEADEDDSDEDDETVELLQSFTKRIILDPDHHYSEGLKLERSEEITFSISSDEPIDFMIMTKAQYNLWAEHGDGKLFVQHSDITAVDDAFEVPRTGWWVLVFSNESSDEATIDFDIATWPACD